MPERNDDDGLGLEALVIVGVVLLMGVIVIGVMGTPWSGNSDLERYDASGDTIGLGVGAEDVALYDSAGNAASFGSGSGSIDASTDAAVGDGNTTIVVWPELHQDALATDNYHAATFGNVSASLQYRSGQWYGYYDVENGGVAEVTADAPSPRTREMVGLRANGTHLAIVHGGAVQNATAFQSGNASPPPARSWWGTQDELRVWDTPLTSTQLANLSADPIGPEAESATTLRLMLDEGSGSSAHVLPGGSSADLVGDVGWSEDGLQPSQFEAGVDYRVNDNTVEILPGSRLDRLQVAYVTHGSTAGSFVSDVGAALLLGAIIPLVIVAVVILRELDGVGSNGGDRR